MEHSKILAEALLRTAHSHDVEHGMNAYNECNHCGQSVYWDEPVETIEHDSECPVLLARSVLRGEMVV